MGKGLVDVVLLNNNLSKQNFHVNKKNIHIRIDIEIAFQPDDCVLYIGLS